MRILHILNDGPSKMSDDIISVQAKDYELKIIDLSKKDFFYESVVDDIFAFDKVISW